MKCLSYILTLLLVSVTLLATGINPMLVHCSGQQNWHLGTLTMLGLAQDCSCGSGSGSSCSCGQGSNVASEEGVKQEAKSCCCGHAKAAAPAPEETGCCSSMEGESCMNCCGEEETGSLLAETAEDNDNEEMEAESCMESTSMSLQPTTYNYVHTDLPSPTEMVTLQALLGCALADLLPGESPQVEFIDTHQAIAPPREILCLNCILRC